MDIDMVATRADEHATGLAANSLNTDAVTISNRQEGLSALRGAALKDRTPDVGLREYWYPIVRPRSVSRRKPKLVKVLGEKVVLFRDKNDEIVALSADCPHRGGQLEMGKCLFKGTISCPYHGWTFDGTGECLAVLGEGPESNIPGDKFARAKSYPTRTLKNIVFIWVGDGEPAPIEEDVPPEFFQDNFMVLSSFTRWDCNWRPAVENYSDAHFFFVHRNSIRVLGRTTAEVKNLVTQGPRRVRPEIVNGRGLTSPGPRVKAYDPSDSGSSSPARRPRRIWLHSDAIKQSYPGLENQEWPKVRIRFLLSVVATLLRRPTNRPVLRVSPSPEIDHEWATLHLPAIARTPNPHYIYTRNVVPIDADKCQVIYFHTRPVHSILGRAFYAVLFHTFYNWWYNYNFSGQDSKVVVYQNYKASEYLSQSDIVPLEWRRHVLEHARTFARPIHEDLGTR